MPFDCIARHLLFVVMWTFARFRHRHMNQRATGAAVVLQSYKLIVRNDEKKQCRRYMMMMMWHYVILCERARSKRTRTSHQSNTEIQNSWNVFLHTVRAVSCVCFMCVHRLKHMHAPDTMSFSTDSTSVSRSNCQLDRNVKCSHLREFL